MHLIIENLTRSQSRQFLTCLYLFSFKQLTFILLFRVKKLIVKYRYLGIQNKNHCPFKYFETYRVLNTKHNC